MAEYLTVKGQSYSVTAGSNTTVTDATGLSLSVEAGGQAQFIACADKVEVEGDCSIVQCRLSSVGSSTRSGGGGVDPSNFVSKVEFAEFQESNEQALEAKQDTLAAGDGISIVDNTVAMSGSLGKSLAIGESHVEETIIHEGLCAVWKWDLPRYIPQFALSETGWSRPYGPEYHGSGMLESYADVEALVVEVNAVDDMAQWARAVAFQDEDGKACFCLIPTPEHSSAEILSDGMWNHPWDDNDPLVHDYGLYPYTDQRVSAVKVVSTDYHLNVNGVEILPATDLVEADNNAPVSSAAVYTKLGEVNTALNSKQDKLTLQTTISNNSSQVATGAAVYKALGNRTSLPAIPTTQTTLSNTTAQVPTGSAVYKALGNRTALTFDSALSTTSTNPIQNKAVAEALSTYATKEELEDATSIEQETLHDSAWADDITPFASGDYLSATATKDLTGTPMNTSMDLQFRLTDSPGIATGDYIHAIKVLLSGSGTGMRLFMPMFKVPLAKRTIPTGGAVSLVGTLYLSSDPLTEEDYARGYTYLYPRGFSLTVNALLAESSLSFGAGVDESNVRFDKSSGPTIPFKTFQGSKVNQSLTVGSCLCATSAMVLMDYVGTPIGVVYMEGAPIKNAVVNNTTAIANNTTAIAAAQAKNVEQDGRLDALEAGGGGGGSSSPAYECWIVLAFGGLDVISCTDYKDDFLVSIHHCADDDNELGAGLDLLRMKFSRAVTIEELHDYFKTAPLCANGGWPAYAGAGYVPLAPYIAPEGTDW